MDHVALGEDAASPGDLSSALGLEANLTYILNAIFQTPRLLVDERTGPSCTVAISGIVYNAITFTVAICEAKILGGLAAHLENGFDLDSNRRHTKCDCLELVDYSSLELASCNVRTASGQANPVNSVRTDRRDYLIEDFRSRRDRPAVRPAIFADANTSPAASLAVQKGKPTTGKAAEAAIADNHSRCGAYCANINSHIESHLICSAPATRYIIRPSGDNYQVKTAKLIASKKSSDCRSND